MNPFVIRPKIEYYAKLLDFTKTKSIGKGDLILLEGFLLNKHKDAFCDGTGMIDISKYCSGEPTDKAVRSIMEAAGSIEYSRIVAIGGGTVLDIAKILSLDNGDKLEALLDKSITPARSRELILVPTTCGTGSEMTDISIIDFTEKNVKMGITGDALYADIAVIIPELLCGIPEKVFAASSIDALIHASESYVSPKANDYTRMFSEKAIEMILEGYKEYLLNGRILTDDLCERFLFASNYAGIAFGNAGCGAVHAMSYPLGAAYHVPHGESNSVFFLDVFKKYHEINSSGALSKWEDIVALSIGSPKENVYEKLAEILGSIITKKTLSEYGMKEEETQKFADIVINSQKRLMANNFVPLDREIVYGIYKGLYE